MQRFCDHVIDQLTFSIYDLPEFFRILGPFIKDIDHTLVVNGHTNGPFRHHCFWRDTCLGADDMATVVVFLSAQLISLLGGFFHLYQCRIGFFFGLVVHCVKIRKNILVRAEGFKPPCTNQGLSCVKRALRSLSYAPIHLDRISARLELALDHPRSKDRSPIRSSDSASKG